MIKTGSIDSLGVKALAKYFIVIYALGLAQEKFGVWIEAVLKSFQRRCSRPGYMRKTA